MSVSDLTGTRWIFNTTLDYSSSYFNFEINFRIYGENTTFNYIETSYSAYSLVYLTYRTNAGDFEVAYNDRWYVSNQIQIFGGKDVTNSTLISWLETNATQMNLDSKEYLTNTYDLNQLAQTIRKVTKNYIGLSYPSGMVDALNNMGIFWTIEQLISTSSLGSLYYSGSITSITSGAFAFKKITTASFPNVTSIDASVFWRCSFLTAVDFSECTFIGSSAFASCYSLTTVSFPECKYIDNYAFGNCSSLTTASFPECTFIGAGGFYGCSSLTMVDFPKCSSFGYGAFSYCTSLTTILLPSCSYFNDYAFAYCSLLTTASFSQCSYIGNYAFAYCSSLSTASFPKCAYIGSYAFRYCYYLISLNLTEVSAVPTLANSNAFSSTPIGGYSTSAGQYGSIYVPSSLYNAFTTTTGWKNFNTRMVSV